MIGIIVLIAFVLPAGYFTLNQVSSGEQIQMDLTLKLKTSVTDIHYQASYHWGATEIDDALTVSNINWVSRTATASVSSSGDFTSRVRDYLSQSEIEIGDSFTASSSGEWALSLQKKLCDGVHLRLEADGNTQGIDELSPSLELGFIPSFLTTALKDLDLDWVDVVVTIKLTIMGNVVRLFVENVFDIALNYANLAKEVVDCTLDRIHSS